jgi:hypothetical protein
MDDLGSDVEEGSYLAKLQSTDIFLESQKIQVVC